MTLVPQMNTWNKPKYCGNYCYLYRQSFCQHIKIVIFLKLERKDVEERWEIQLIFSFSISPLWNWCYIYLHSVSVIGQNIILKKNWDSTISKISPWKVDLGVTNVEFLTYHLKKSNLKSKDDFLTNICKLTYLKKIEFCIC